MAENNGTKQQEQQHEKRTDRSAAAKKAAQTRRFGQIKMPGLYVEEGHLIEAPAEESAPEQGGTETDSTEETENK